ncbi:MAG: NUDIX domain-containing protein [Actinobacteria bacterium]|nr:NUDIX domain-containing protein [Actinomycetota bacterium]
MPQPTSGVPAPATRPRVRRRTARLLVVDEADRVLLFRDSDLGLNPVPHWWMTPGGGVDPGESDLEAAVRELHEETGLAVDAGSLFGPVATRRVVHGYSDVIVDQDEVFFGVRTTGFAPDSSGYTEEEAACIVATEWLTRDDVTAASEPVWPAELVMIWDHWEAMTGDPGLVGLALPDTEESTVPSEGPQPA